MIVWLFLDLFFSTMGWWCLIDMIVEWFLIFGTCDLTRPSLNHLMFQTTYVPFSACSSLFNKVFQVGEFFYLYSNLISLSYQYLNWFCLTEVNTSLLWLWSITTLAGIENSMSLLESKFKLQSKTFWGKNNIVCLIQILEGCSKIKTNARVTISSQPETPNLWLNHVIFNHLLCIDDVSKVTKKRK